MNRHESRCTRQRNSEKHSAALGNPMRSLSLSLTRSLPHPLPLSPLLSSPSSPFSLSCSVARDVQRAGKRVCLVHERERF